MMSKRKGVLFPIVAAALNLPACSYIQSLFPDKEKDYQYTTEIPPLVLPRDLSLGAAAKAAGSSSAPESDAVKEDIPPSAATGEEGTDSTGQSGSPPDNAGSAEKPVPPEENAGQPGVHPQETEPVRQEQAEQRQETVDSGKEGTAPVELVRFSDGERRLRISSSPDQAWYLVSKALSRNAIEVTERNQSQKLFFVRYAPDAKKAEDGSLLDEAVFLFKGFEANEKEYLLKLLPVDDKTDLAVTDKDLNPVSQDDAAVKLLRLLGGTIQGN